MDTSSTTTNKTGKTPTIAFAGGGGPAALVAAIALARRGIATTLFERDQHPEATGTNAHAASSSFYRMMRGRKYTIIYHLTLALTSGRLLRLDFV
jgi:NADPH-dependent 2,4-dienoyl-CoA reductase/sulfur reductase-like enzyme